MKLARRMFIAWAIVAAARAAPAQQPWLELKLDASTLELGEAVSFELVCTNIGRPDTPQAAVPDGLDLKLLNTVPSKGSFTQIVNGRMSQRTTYKYAMRLTALKEGTYTFGPVSVVADGKTYETQPVQIVVRDTQIMSVPRGDRYVYAELEVEPRSLYVTQTYTATLTFGIRKVEIGGRVYRMDLLRDVLDQRASQLSVFSDGQVRRTERWLRDSAGTRHRYEVFTVTKEIRAEEVGEILVGPVFLKLNYPTALRRGFFGSHDITRARKETARNDAVTVEVKAPPEGGRPNGYTGAIGRFTMNVSAKPTRVEQGQPITLTVAIEGTPLEGIAGPDLTQQPELISRFDFTADELVGDLERGAKVFRRALFPKQVGEQTVPSISWSFFDVLQERYVTLTSEPVPITVDPPPATTTTIIMPAQGDLAPEGTALTVLTGGISPNYVDAEAVLANQVFTFTPSWIASLIASPLVWLIVTAAARHRARLRTDTGLARRRRARRRALTRIGQALRRDRAEHQVNGLAETLRGYVADRFGLPGGTLTPGDVKTLLTENGIDATVAAAISDFLEKCDAVRYASGTLDALTPSDAADEVRRWIKRLEGELH